MAKFMRSAGNRLDLGSLQIALQLLLRNPDRPPAPADAVVQQFTGRHRVVDRGRGDPEFFGDFLDRKHDRRLVSFLQELDRSVPDAEAEAVQLQVLDARTSTH